MAPKVEKKEKKTKRTALQDVVSREVTIHLHKHVHGRSFKSRAPSAIKAIRDFVHKEMGTKDVRIDATLNKAVWSQGIKNVPHRLRLILSRKRNDDEDATEKLYTHVTHVAGLSLTKSNRKGTLRARCFFFFES